MEWVVAIIGALGGGAVGVIIQVLAQRGKTKVESESVLVKSALDIEEIAMNRYTMAEQKLSKIKDELEEVQAELSYNRRYISYLLELLKKGEIKHLSEVDFRKTLTVGINNEKRSNV